MQLKPKKTVNDLLNFRLIFGTDLKMQVSTLNLGHQSTETLVAANAGRANLWKQE
jgi:hypothetical protein